MSTGGGLWSKKFFSPENAGDDFFRGVHSKYQIKIFSIFDQYWSKKRVSLSVCLSVCPSVCPSWFDKATALCEQGGELIFFLIDCKSTRDVPFVGLDRVGLMVRSVKEPEWKRQTLFPSLTCIFFKVIPYSYEANFFCLILESNNKFIFYSYFDLTSTFLRL